MYSVTQLADEKGFGIVANKTKFVLDLLNVFLGFIGSDCLSLFFGS